MTNILKPWRKIGSLKFNNFLSYPVVGQGLGKDTHPAQAIPARAEALGLGVVIIEVVAQVMEEEVEVTKSMKEVKEDIVEEVMNRPLGLLLERNTLHRGVREGDMMTEEIGDPPDTIAEVVIEIMIINSSEIV